MSDKEEVEAIAALVGHTNAALRNVDEHIVSSSTNLQKSADQWDPKSVLKQGLQSTGNLNNQPVQQQPQQVGQPQQVVPPAGVHPEVQQPMPQQIMHQPIQHVQPQAFITDPQILQRLDKIEEALSKLNVTEEKIMKSLLKNNTKQITIRFDDPKPTK
jgi:hypothetical protein